MKWKTGIVCLMIISLFTFHAWCDEPRDISKINEKLTLEFKDANVKDILRLFRDISTLDFVFDECVQGKVTIKLENVPVYDAFRLLLENAGLDYEQEGNLVRITCKADSNTTNTDSNESAALPGIRAKVFASIREIGGDESKTLPMGMEKEFPDGYGLFMIAPALPETVPPVELKTFDKNGNFILKPQPPLVIMFTLKNSFPGGVKVKVSFSYSYAEELDTDTNDKAYRTISGTREKLITSSNVEEPILLLKAPDGDEFYLNVIPEELSQ